MSARPNCMSCGGRLPVRPHLRPKPQRIQLGDGLVWQWEWVEIGEWNAKDGSWCERQLSVTVMPLDLVEALECWGQA